MTDFLLDHTAVNFFEPSPLLGLDFGSYLVFIAIILLLMFGLETLKDHGDPYTRAEYVADLQEGTVREIVITPNKEAPTGYATVIFEKDTKQIYATDI